MRSAPSTIFQSMRLGLNYSATTAKEIYYRAHDIIKSTSTRHIPIERVISDFLSSLNQSNLRVLCKHLTPELSRKVHKLCGSGAVQIQTLSRILGGDPRERVSDYEVLLRYKQPFSELGEDQYLIYTKLRLPSEDRYLAMWIKRNVHGQASWKIEDLLIHDAYHKLSLGVQDAGRDSYTRTVLGRAVNDSISSALFFTRLLTGACPALPTAQLIDQSQRCNEDFAASMHTKVTELLSTLHRCAFTDDYPKIPPQLQHMVRSYRRYALEGDVSSVEEAAAYHLLSLYRVPSDSKHTTRIMAHVFVPSINRYLTLWFSRSSLRSLTWSIADFYIHKFGSVKACAHADKKYCMKTFRTLKTRVFYTPDLIGEVLLKPASDQVSA